MTKKVKKYKHGGLHSPFDAPGMLIDDVKKYLKERPKKKDLKRLEKYKDMIMGGLTEEYPKQIGDMYDSRGAGMVRRWMFGENPSYPLTKKQRERIFKRRQEDPNYHGTIKNLKKGGSVKKKAVKKKAVKKKAVSSKRVKAHRGDGIAKRGRTRGRIV
jgi:hypothetical protein